MIDPLRYRLLTLLLLTVSLASCRSTGSSEVMRSTPAFNSITVVRTELYFGLSKAHGGDVSDVEWRGFLDSIVTPRFPEGLTVLDAAGQYRLQSGVIQRERSKLIILFYDPTPERRGAIDEIRAAYKRLFDQESVLRIDSYAGFSD